MSMFRLPDVGEGLHEAEIVAWHVSPGDRVVADQPLVSIETDKAIVEIPSPQSGRIKALYGAVGDVVGVGSDLAEFEDADRADAGAVVGELPEEPPEPVKSGSRRQQFRGPVRRRKAAPAVRALAANLGVDLGSVEGSGPGGAITSSDVHEAAASDTSADCLRGARRSMAQAMSRAGREVVPATIQDVAVIDGWPQNADPTTRLIRAIVAGVSAEPKLNAHFHGERLELSVRRRVDLGIAVDTPEGLFVPVVKDAGALDDETLKERLETLKQAVADRTASPGDLTGQTFTLSNFGMITGRHVTLVVVPPQVAILGAGRIDHEAVVVDGKVAVSRTLPLSLTFDHRAITGGEAARFLAAVIADLQQPQSTAGMLG